MVGGTVVGGTVVGGTVVGGAVVAVAVVVVESGTAVVVVLPVVEGPAEVEVKISPGISSGRSKVHGSWSAVARCMKLRQIDAGNEPPVTARPCTLLMKRIGSPGAPTYPIHTAAVSWQV